MDPYWAATPVGTLAEPQFGPGTECQRCARPREAAQTISEQEAGRLKRMVRYARRVCRKIRCSCRPNQRQIHISRRRPGSRRQLRKLVVQSPAFGADRCFPRTHRNRLRGASYDRRRQALPDFRLIENSRVMNDFPNMEPGISCAGVRGGRSRDYGKPSSPKLLGRSTAVSSLV